MRFRLFKYLYFLSHKVRSLLLFWAVRNHQEDIHDLAAYVFKAFRDLDLAFNKVMWGLYNQPGYDAGEGKLSICWEAPVAITLFRNDQPILGMGLELHRDYIAIRQLVGEPGVVLPEHLRSWPRLFVRTCIAFAEDSGISEVRLYRADQDLFYHEPHVVLRKGETRAEVVKAIQQRMRRRYDGTARQLGFTMKKKYGEWKNPDYARP